MGLINLFQAQPVVAGPETTVLEAAILMASEEVSSVVVVNQDNQVQGVFTECDNLCRVTMMEKDRRTTALAQVMTAPVVTVTAETTIEDALTLMVGNRFSNLPIVDLNHRIIGIVSIRDLLMRRIGEKQDALELMEAFACAGGPG
jgi:CBS domain-containing protein